MKQLIHWMMQWIILLTKLDDAIHDMEAGRVQTIEEAWKEIDEI